MDTLQQSVAELQSLFLQRMDSYQGELQAASSSPTVAVLSADFTAFRTFIMTALRCLQDQVGLVMQQQDAMEMRGRRKILLLHGVPETRDEDTTSVVVKLVTSQMKIPDFSSKDISRSHRMGRASAPDKPRPILFKIRDLDAKNRIWSGKTGLKGSNITLSEFLTKPRHDTFMAARQKFGIQRCWTRDGFVFVLGTDGVRHRISNLKELDKIAASSAPRTAGTAAVTTRARDTAPPSKSRRAPSASKK